MSPPSDHSIISILASVRLKIIEACHDIEVLADGSSLKYIAGIALVGGIGLGTFAVHTYHLLVQYESSFQLFLGAFLPLGISVALIAIAAWIHTNEYDDTVFRVGIWCLVGSVTLMSIGVASISYQFIEGIVMENTLFVITNHATAGGFLGSILGLYDGQRKRRKIHLYREQQRAHRLGNRLTILNRVLRHDLRHTINIIQGNTRLLRDGNGEVDKLTSNILDKTGELQEMGERARKLQKLIEPSSGDFEHIDLVPIVKSKVFKIKNRYPEVTVELTVPEKVTVKTSPLIDAVIDELLENAIKHNRTDDTTIGIYVSVKQSHKLPSEAVRIRVRDNGTGIPKDEINVLKRGHETDLEHTSGLGLWLVRWVVEVSNGKVEFPENESDGSCIDVWLPLAQSGAQPRPDLAS